MFCKQCGNELKEGATFCGTCGTKVEVESTTAPVEETAVEETPVEETSIAEAPTAEAPAATVPESNVSYDMPKKKSKMPKILIIVAAVVVLLGGGFLLFKDAIMNKLAAFGSPEAQLQTAYANTAKKWGELGAEIVTGINDATEKTEGTLSGKFSVTIGKDVKEMLESVSGVDLGKISTVFVSYQIAGNENEVLFEATVGLEDKNLLSMNMVMDMEEGRMAIAVPELSKTAIEFEFENDLGVDLEEFTSSMAQVSQYTEMLQKVLPEEELVEDMIPRYIGAMFEAITEAERKEETLEVEGVSQKATSLTIHINAELVKNIGIKLAEELENDKELESYLKDLASNLTFGIGIDDETWNESYKQIGTAVKQAFEELASEFDLDIEVVTWVNSDSEIIGIEVPDYIQYLSAKDGKDTATVFIIDEPEYEGEIFKLLIKGKESGDEFAGDVTFFVEAEEVITIKVDKYVSTDKKFELDASITLTKEMFREMTGETNPLGDITLKVEIASTETDSNITFRGIVAGKEYVALSMESSYKDDAKITYPKKTLGMDEADEWIQTIDITDVMNDLDDLGVFDMLGVSKADLMQGISEIMDGGISLDGLFGGYDADDYYEDSYDYDYYY